MSIHYSGTANGFFVPSVHGAAMPADAKPISAEQHAALIAGQAAGKRIVPDANGTPVLADPLPLTPAGVTATLTAAVQEYMDNAARAAGYDDIKSAVTYADEPSVPRFQAEGQAFRAWRSICWNTCYQVMGEVLGGTRGIPTTAELIAALPALELPA